MKNLLTILAAMAMLPLFAETYSLGNKMRPVTVDVVPSSNNQVRITCTFKDTLKFSPDKNAELNRRKADRYCQQGLLRYMNAKPGQSVELPGIAVEKGPTKSGDMITYYFSAHNVPVLPAAKTESSEKVAVGTKMAGKPAQASKSTLVVIHYTTENDQIKVFESSEYQPKAFKSRKEFDDFCSEQFDKINKLAAQNRHDILKKFEDAKKDILNN